MSRYRWTILGAGTFAQSTFAATGVGLPALAPALRSEYGLSLGQIGVVLGAGALGMLSTMLAWGLLADRIGERRVIGLGLGGCGLALTAIAWTTSFAALLGLLVLAGALGASVNAASGRAVMGWFGAEERGLALGIRQTAVPIGGAIAAVALPWLASDGDTKTAFLALGGSSLAGAAVAAVLLREAPPRQEHAHAGVAQPLRDARMWLLAGGSGLFVLAQVALTGYVVLFLHQHRGLSAHAAGGVLAVMNVLGIGARIAGGRWSDRVRARVGPLRIVGACLTFGTVAVAALVDAPLVVLIPAFVVAGVFSLSWNGLAFTAAAESAGPLRSGAALGFQQTALAVLGSAGAPAFAALVGATSWRTAFAVSAAAPLAGVLLLRLVPEVSEAGRRPGTSAIPPAAR